MESAVEEVTVSKTSQLAGGNAVFALTSGRDGELIGSFGLVMTSWRRLKKSALPVCRSVAKDLCSFTRIALMSPKEQQVDGLVTLYVDGCSPTRVLDPHRILVVFDVPNERLRKPKGTDLKHGAGLSVIFTRKDVGRLHAKLESAEVQAVMDVETKKKRPNTKRFKTKFILKAHRSAALKKAMKAMKGGKHFVKGKKSASKKMKKKKPAAVTIPEDIDDIIDGISDDIPGDAEKEPPSKKAKMDAGAVSLALGKNIIEDCADNYNRFVKGKALMQQRIWGSVQPLGPGS